MLIMLPMTLVTTQMIYLLTGSMVDRELMLVGVEGCEGVLSRHCCIIYTIDPAKQARASSKVD